MNIDFDKSGGLLPAIIQDAVTGKVLMLGYMNQESYQKTLAIGKVTFYSRSRQQLWTKGETSGNFLLFKEIKVDCDGDTLLVKAIPTGPVCHTGNDTCFNEINTAELDFLNYLEKVIQDRKTNPQDGSYTNKLFDAGIKKIAQKVGEEATELVIDAVAGNTNRIKEEAADLLYHLLVLLVNREIVLKDVISILEQRQKK
jgi:phosphoribosyl-ATP pyrophosphohydrolase/phosphoribosyl-AMP cyclohydrolase